MPAVEPERWSLAHLTDDLRRLGVAAGDSLMVHASLRAVGPVDGGADGLIDALKTAVGPEGTLFMTLGARDDWAWVNEHPEDHRSHLLRDAEPFDCLVTPADPDVGVLAETFRNRRDTMVSDHPEGRFGASGSLAATLLDNVPWDDYYGPGSPLQRFVEARGRVLRLGADIDTMTVLHYAEYLAPIPAKRRVRRHRVVTGRHGPELRVIECLDDSDGIVEHPGEDYFAVILRQYLATGRPSTGRVGRAISELIEANDIVEFAVKWLADNLVPRRSRG
jgi:aminoglycoside N3'-acetyltransferase